MAEQQQSEQQQTEQYEQLELPLGVDTSEADARKAALQAELAEVCATNAAKQKELAGMGVRADPDSVIMQRVNTLLDLALDPVSRLRFELAFERGMTQSLERCLVEARKLLLARGSGQTPTGPQPSGSAPVTGLIMPGG